MIRQEKKRNEERRRENIERKEEKSREKGRERERREKAQFFTTSTTIQHYLHIRSLLFLI